MSTAERPKGDSSLLWLAPRSLIGLLKGTLWRALGGSNALGLGLPPYGLLSAPGSGGWMGGTSTTQGDPGAGCYFATSFSLHLESDQMFLLASLDAGAWWRLSRKAAGQKPPVGPAQCHLVPLLLPLHLGDKSLSFLLLGSQHGVLPEAPCLKSAVVFPWNSVIFLPHFVLLPSTRHILRCSLLNYY